MSTAFSLILPHVPVFALVMARLTGLFLLAPVLSSTLVPRQVRVMLTLTMALCVYPAVNHAAAMELTLDLFELLPAMAGEVLIGMVIGLLALLPLAAVQFGGLIMGQQMGLGLAQVLNPAVDIESDNIGQILFMGALVVFLQAGGLDILFSSLITTFDRLPPGGASLSIAPLELVTGILSSSYTIAVRIALPVVALMLLESAASALIMKTVPSINIMSIGFPIRVFIGLIMLTAGLAAIGHVLLGDLSDTFDIIARWASSLGSVGGG
jgi:flagellar biosynthetic protein FliR